MPKKPAQHVVPDGEGWAVRKEGASRDTAHFDTKKPAEDAARGIAKNQKTELIVHKQDGTIQRRDSYGGDPFPPRG